MTKVEKHLQALRDAQSQLDWLKLSAALKALGYQLDESSAGSRVIFVHKQDSSDRIYMHKPHPRNYIRAGTLKALKDYLKQRGHL